MVVILQQYTERLQAAISFHRILQIVSLRWPGCFMIRSVILDNLFLQSMPQLLFQHCVLKETELSALQHRNAQDIRDFKIQERGHDESRLEVKIPKMTTTAHDRDVNKPRPCSTQTR